ncbi:tyrosine-type recombinase/integrase [Holdemanella biformis]|uniref:tyrosine-type recombinase/integrase n=1 Tax=Holdemanella biformis TaxID=1735 RepID=UPI003A523A45
MNQSYINILFKEYIKNFSFYVPTMRFHNLRDTYATLMLKNGCNIFTLKKLLGHSCFSSTSRYIKYDISDLAQAPVLSSLREIE